MYGLKKEVFNDIINVIKKYENIECVYLFGSRARGDYNDKSDIDIAIIQKGDVTLKLKRELDELRCIYTFDVVDMNLIGEKLKENIEKEIERIKRKTIKANEKTNELLEKYNTTPITNGTKLADLIKRTELDYEKLAQLDEDRPELTKQEREEVNIQVKYEGYIKMQEEQVEKFKKLEEKKLSENIEYSKINGLCLEARQKLDKFKPTSVGQASRISGVSPADISVLLIYLEQRKK